MPWFPPSFNLLIVIGFKPHIHRAGVAQTFGDAKWFVGVLANLNQNAVTSMPLCLLQDSVDCETAEFGKGATVDFWDASIEENAECGP